MRAGPSAVYDLAEIGKKTVFTGSLVMERWQDEYSLTADLCGTTYQPHRVCYRCRPNPRQQALPLDAALRQTFQKIQAFLDTQTVALARRAQYCQAICAVSQQPAATRSQGIEIGRQIGRLSGLNQADRRSQSLAPRLGIKRSGVVPMDG